MSLELFYSLCTQAKIYLILSILGLTGSKNLPKSYVGKFIYFAIHLLLIFIWTYFLQLLCRKGYFKVAWFLVLFPIIFLFVILFFIILMALFSSSKKKEKEIIQRIKHPEKGVPNTSPNSDPIHRRGEIGIAMSDVIIDI